VQEAGQIVGGGANWKPDQMQGVGPDFLIIRNWGIAAGEMFTDRDVQAANKVCVIGRTIQQKLFPGQDPIGEQVRIKNIPFTVVGVLEPKGADLGGRDQDDVLLERIARSDCGVSTHLPSAAAPSPKWKRA